MAEETLRILIIQPDIVWMKVTENLRRYSKLLSAFQQPVDLVLLPEMFTTGFMPVPEEFNPSLQEEAMEWLKRIASDFRCTVAGSLAIHENMRWYNRLVCISPDGETQSYNKRHLFRMAGENEYYENGNQRIISIVKGWRICWQICYDLRFPVWSRNRKDYDLLVYVANWPARRSDVWKTLLKARAIENQSYVIGVNRVGKDGNAIEHLGESAVIDPKGNPVIPFAANEEMLITAELKYSSLIGFRNKFPVLEDGDDFKVL